jgi:flavin reductase (DIM6/NTAB) family NADH-FMN oxidoreductase RutF
MRLPVLLQRRIRGLPQWSPVALQQPQQAVQIRMTGAGTEVDVTRGVVVAALKPLTLAIAVDEQTGGSQSSGSQSSGAAIGGAREQALSPHLRFVDVESQQTVGQLQLTHMGNWSTSGIRLGLFEVRSGNQRCLRWPYRGWNHWLQNRAIRRNTDSQNFSMPPEAVQQLMIFYICPRPVVLVSVDDGSHSNLFPMDLIGPVSADRFTLALRSTSQSVETMKSARRIVLADVPAGAHRIASNLGVHHKRVKVEWEQLPFKTLRSANFGLRYPDFASRVREVEILDFDTVGSHTFFVTRFAAEMPIAEVPGFFHTSGIFQYYRNRRRHPLPAAL